MKRLFRTYIPELDLAQENCEGWIPLHCPLPGHNDRHPSAGFNNNSGVLNCMVCGSFSPRKLLSILAGISETEAQRIIDAHVAEEIKTYEDTFTTSIHISPHLTELARLAVESMEHNALVDYYCQSRGIQYETLLRAGVGYLAGEHTSWGRDSIVIPYRIGGRVVGLRYRDMLGSKSGEPGCHFCLWGLDTMTDDTRHVVLVEGETDRLVTMQACPGMVVLSTPTAAFRREWGRELSDVHVILVPQDDEAGQKLVGDCRHHLGDRVSVVRLPWKRSQLGNDVADWLSYNTPEDLRALIEAEIPSVTRRIMTGHEFAAAASEPRKWLLSGLLARRQMGVIAGQPKTYKTWLALNLVKALIDPGSCFCGLENFVCEEKEPQNVLVIEEEGDIEELYKRAEMVLGDVDHWLDHTFWGHYTGIQLDSPEWEIKLSETIRGLDIDLVIIDPFQRTYSIDENNASEMGLVWGTLARLLARHPRTSILTLCHLNKGGVLRDRWKSIRGSSRTAAECDLGIFVDTLPRTQGLGIRMVIDGRSIPHTTAPNGSEEFKLMFEDGVFSYDTMSLHVGKWSQLIAEMAVRGTWYLADAADHFGVSEKTVKRWVSNSIDPETQKPLMTLTKPAPGQAVQIQYCGGNNSG